MVEERLNMFDAGSIQELLNRGERIEASQGEIESELASVGAQLDALLKDAERQEQDLKGLESAPRAEKAPEGPRAPEVEFTEILERLLQGSLEGLGDKISRKILDKLKGLRALSGPEREDGVRELKELADSEAVDLSALFSEKVKSNIQDIGVEEKETKGIDEGLRKLREMRGGGNEDEESE